MSDQIKKPLGGSLALTDERLEALALPTPADVEAVRLLWQSVLTGWEADLMEADRFEIVEEPQAKV